MSEIGVHECNSIEGSPRTHWAESGGNGGWCWMMKEINGKLKEREEVHQSEGTHTKPYKSLNGEVCFHEYA